MVSFCYLFGQSFSPAIFRVTNIWRNATLPAVRCKSFTFYKVVRWHFSGVVGKGVTACFLLITFSISFWTTSPYPESGEVHLYTCCSLLSGVTIVGVTLGGNWGCHPYFSRKTDDLFSHHRLPVLRCHPYLFCPKNWRPFCSSLSLYWYFTRVSCIPWRVSPAPFYLSDLVCRLFCINLPTVFSFWCHPGSPPWRVSLGAVRPTPPPSDATD